MVSNFNIVNIAGNAKFTKTHLLQGHTVVTKCNGVPDSLLPRAMWYMPTYFHEIVGRETGKPLRVALLYTNEKGVLKATGDKGFRETIKTHEVDFLESVLVMSDASDSSNSDEEEENEDFLFPRYI